MEDLKKTDGAADDLILPLSTTSPSNAGSRNPPPPHSHLLIHQLCTVPKGTCNGERLGDDVMGVQDSQASLVGVLAGGVSFSDQDDQRALTPEPDMGDFLSVSFSLEPGVSQVQLLATDEELLLDVGGFEAVVQGFFADVSVPFVRAIKDGSEMVESLSAQESVYFFAWRKTFSQISYQTFLQVVQAELKTGITHMEATFMGYTLLCSEAFEFDSL